MIIVFDPGHGGHEAVGKSSSYGTRLPSGRYEKDLTLELCHRAARQFGNRAVLTRTHDTNISLAERIAVARRYGARAFLSVHAHEGPHTGESGVWVHPRARPQSFDLARSLAQALGSQGYGAPVRQAELAVLSPERLGPTAACMVELNAANPRLQETNLDFWSARLADGLNRFQGRSASGAAYGAQAPNRLRDRLAAQNVIVEPAMAGFNGNNKPYFAAGAELAFEHVDSCLAFIIKTPGQLVGGHVAMQWVRDLPRPDTGQRDPRFADDKPLDNTMSVLSAIQHAGLIDNKVANKTPSKLVCLCSDERTWGDALAYLQLITGHAPWRAHDFPAGAVDILVNNDRLQVQNAKHINKIISFQDHFGDAKRVDLRANHRGLFTDHELQVKDVSPLGLLKKGLIPPDLAMQHGVTKEQVLQTGWKFIGNKWQPPAN